MRASWLLACCVAGALLCAPRVRAQDQVPPRYQELVDHGLAESAAGRFAEARVDFRQAHALYPNARTLRVIGMVAYELRDYVDAVRHLQLALSEPRKALDDQQRFQVSQLLQQAVNLVGRYSTVELPRGSTLVVDGLPATPEPNSVLLLSVGEHRVQVRADGRVHESVITVRGGENAPLPIAIAEPQAAPVAAPVPAAEEAPSEPTAETLSESSDVPLGPSDEAAPPADEPFPIGPVLTISAGAVAAGVGAVLLVVGLGDISDIESAQPGTQYSSVASTHEGTPLLTGLGIGLLAAGGVTALIGTIWLVSDDDDKAAPQLALNVGPLSVGARASW